MSRAAKSGCIAAVIHLLFVCVIAAGVASNKSNGAELWVLAAYVDLPVYFLPGFVLQAASVLFYWDPPFVAAHDFLFCLFFFAVAGSAQWWLIVAVSRRRSHAGASNEDI
jgi:hypothetical protein